MNNVSHSVSEFRLLKAGKTTDAMAWQYQGGHWPMVGCFKRSSAR